jgi:hypothetical protein
LNVQLAWPLGNDLKPSFMISSSVFVQMASVTRTHAALNSAPTMGLIAADSRRLRSGRQRDSRSGRGFPNNSFMPWVIMNAVASESASPIQPVFHSHSFLLQMSDFAVPRLAVGPGTKMMDTTKTMAAGMMKATRTKSHVGIVSCFSNGYDMSRLTGENGRLNGVRNSQPAPRAAIPLQTCVSCELLLRCYRADGRERATIDVHDADPIKDVRQYQPYRR